MPARIIREASYTPLLTVRPAELRALQELPERDKDLLLPYFFLRPWASAHRLDAALDKITAAYGDRPLFIDLAGEEFSDTPRPVHDALAQLRDAADGYANWCAFIEAHSNYMPALQLGDPAAFDAQVRRLVELQRGIAVRFPRQALPLVADFARRLQDLGAVDGGLLMILDYGRGSRDLLLQQAATVGLIRSIKAVSDQINVAFCASSFPDTFVGLDEQEIYERALFKGIVAQIGREGLIYSDRGSARAERQLGGGGAPAPRIDYALPLKWTFFRSDSTSSRATAYRGLAQKAMDDPQWDNNLRLWGTQMIERTVLGDPDAITSPARSTATRINIHLHRQLFYDDPGAGLYDTDEEWSDL